MSALLGLGVSYRGVDFREKIRRIILLRKDVPPRRHERFEHLIEGFGFVLCHHGPSESYLPQSSSASRRTAGASGFLILSQ